MTRAFTNVKALENKPVQGYEKDTWEYRDTPEGGIDSPLLMQLDESIKASQGGVVTNAVPTNQAIDSDIVDIDNFRKTWISQKGFNPWNWQTEFQQKFQSSIQAVWNKTFQGKIRYGSSLTTDQAKLLKQNMSTYYTALENQYKSKSEDAKDEYDIIVEQVNKRNTRIETEQKETKEAQKAESKRQQELEDYETKEHIKEQVKQGYEKPTTTTEKPPSASQLKTELQEEMTMAETRGNLIKNKKDIDYFETNAPLFNKRNTNNEVSFWDEEKEQVKILKLPKFLVDKGITPADIQRAANETGQTIKQVLADFNVILETVK